MQCEQFIFEVSDKMEIYLKDTGYLQYVRREKIESIEPAVPHFLLCFVDLSFGAQDPCAMPTGTENELHRLNVSRLVSQMWWKLILHLLPTY